MFRFYWKHNNVNPMKLDEDSSDEEFHNYNQKSPELSIDNRGPSIKVMD